MITLKIPDMSCSHCVGVITSTLKALDKDARIEFDLPGHTARVDSAQGQAALLTALDAAGYPASVA